MKKATSAGGVVIKTEKGEKKVLLIKFADGTGLGFPKGHIDKGENIKKAALREVKEEAGLSNISIIKKLGVVTRPSIEDDGTRVKKDIHLFLMKTDDYNHIEADENYGWFTIEEAIKKMGFLQEAEFLRRIKKGL